MPTLGTTIKLIRTYRNKKQADLAKAANITPVTLCNIEHDKILPSKNTLASICQELMVPVPFVLLMSLDEKFVAVEKREEYNSHILALQSILSIKN